MQISVNGKVMEIAPETTILSLLETRGLNADRVVVELNRAIVTRSEFDSWVIPADGELEILSFVGGGFHA